MAQPAAAPVLGPTPEQLAHGHYETVQIKDPDRAESRLVRRATHTRNLERWLNRQLIDARMFQAGDKYRADWERAGFQQRATSCYDVVTCGGQAGHYRAPGGQNVAQMDAWKRWRLATEVMPPGLRAGFDWLVLHDEIGLEVLARDASGAWTRRTALGRVKAGLVVLADHYGLPVA